MSLTLIQLVAEQQFIIRDVSRMPPLVVGDAQDIDRMQQVGGISPFDLPVDQAGAIVDEPVVHVIVTDILHFDQESVAGGGLEDDIEGG